MEKVKVTYLGKSYMYPKDITLEDISKDFQENYSETIIMAEVNGRPYELNYKVTDDVTVDFFDLTSPTGNRVYESGLIFVLEKACLNMLNSEIEVKYSIDKGIYIKTYKKITKEDLDKVSREMKEIVKRDLPIQKNLVNRLEAIEYYKSTKSYDKVNVLKYSVNTNVNLYRLMDIYNYFFSYLPVSTGALKEFKLTYIDQNSFVLRYPNIYYLNKIPVYKHHDKLFNEFKKYDEWSEKLGIENVSSLNSRVTKGNVDDIVLLSENIQNNSLFRIAETIYNNKKLKLILLAGPSSSGKTTTSKKLELFLKGFGLNPIAISIDNYFVDRDKTPRLPDGSYDFESLNSINVELFNKNLKDLLDGKEVTLPVYNFITGKSELSDESIKLGEKEILIVEGLHALNEELTYSIDKKNKYKIYLCPLTVLSLDNHNRIRTTDNRLLRRIVRDNRTRGYSASDTLSSWGKVREGEEKYVFPFQDEADVIFNTSLIYELGVLKTYAEPLLYSVEESDPMYKEAVRLLNLLKNILPISNDYIPVDSIVREFIGGGYFKL
ncbi:fision threonyl-tRNA synthetase (N-terminal part) and uridine kinase [Clostridium sp. CAG:433]|nr:fision threonyl-tRNA synthetase (N-terminal part) and uridine kinase [Clostridium sp. CAG:433]